MVFLLFFKMNVVELKLNFFFHWFVFLSENIIILDILDWNER